MDYKKFFKDLEDIRYTAGDTFHFSEYLLHNGKSLTEKQKEQVNKYGGAIDCSSDGSNIILGARNSVNRTQLSFSYSRYQTKQKPDYHTSKKDVNEQRVLLCDIIKADTLPEPTEIATKPEDGGWHIYYQGEKAQLPFSIKNQTPERLKEIEDVAIAEGSSSCMDNHYLKEFVHLDTDIFSEYDYKTLTVNTSKPYLKHVQIYDTLKDKYPNHISQEPLSDFWIVVLPIAKEGDTYYAERDELLSNSRAWYFPYPERIGTNEDWQINIKADGMIYRATNQDNTFNDFYAKYKKEIDNNDFNDFLYGRGEWNVTVVEDGIQYNNKDNTLQKLDEKYARKTEEGYYGWKGLSDFYDMAIQKGWEVTVEKNDICYSTKNPDNTVNDFARKYDLFIDRSRILNNVYGLVLPEDFSFTYGNCSEPPYSKMKSE